MKQLTITKERFLDWYFDYGQDQENLELRTNLANLHQMYGSDGCGCGCDTYTWHDRKVVGRIK